MKSCSSVPSVWDALAIFWVDLELCHSRSSLPPRLRPALLHSCCCPWRSSHGPVISQILVSLLQLGYTFTNILPWAIFGYSDHVPSFQAPSSLRDPFIPGASPAPEGVPTPVVSHGASPQLVSMVPSRLPNWYHLRNSYVITNCIGQHRV